MKEEIKKELIERYQQTGKIGFAKPSSEKEAYALIDLILNYESPEKEEKIILNIPDLTRKMQQFFNNL